MKKKLLAVLLATGVAATTLLGGSILVSAADDGVQLPMETSKFEKFTQEEYDKVYAGLKDGSIKIANDTVAKDAKDLPTSVVKVESIK